MQKLSFIMLTLWLVYSCNNSAYHSFSPGEIWKADDGLNLNAHGGGILFFNGNYYLFGECMTDGNTGDGARIGVSCYASDDLYNWKNEGIALKVSDDTTSEIRKGCILQRPKVIYNRKTEKFVMWFHLELYNKGYSSARCGIAKADNITGPYTFIKSIRPDAGSWPVNVLPVNKEKKYIDRGIKYSGGSLPAPPDSLNILGRDFETGQMARDMNLFADDDGKAYLIYSSEENSTLHISLLSDDYLSTSGIYARAFVGRFMEGAAIFKNGGKYYFVGSGCTGWAPNAARSAKADSILGPWTELGNPCIDADSALTYHAQSSFVLSVQGKNDAHIFMADRWVPEQQTLSTQVWLPVEFRDNRFILHWLPEWDLGYFNKKLKQ